MSATGDKLGYSLRPEAASTLAALRIVVPLLILLGPELTEGVRVAGMPAALRVAPEGLAWFVRVVPIDPRIARGVEVVAAFTALLSIVGVRARLALTVLTLSSFYLFALAELTGSVWHDMHLLWLCALLSASPCDRAFAVDRVAGPTWSTTYAPPLLFARLLLGAVYFFPGIHKLMTSGLAWALSDNLRDQLYWKWAEHGVIPSFRIDEHPWMLKGGGLFVLAFELAAPVLFVVRRTRGYAAILGVVFHLFAQAVFLIPFLSLWGCYVVLLDIPALASRLRRLLRRPAVDPSTASGELPAERAPRSMAAIVVGTTMLAGAVVAGVRGQMQAFPFACYPTFEWMPGTQMPDLQIVAVLADGREVTVPHARDASGHRGQRQWGMVWSLAGVARSPGERPRADLLAARLRAYYRDVTRDEPQRSLVRDAVRIRFFRVLVSVLPEDRDSPPVAADLLAEMVTP